MTRAAGIMHCRPFAEKTRSCVAAVVYSNPRRFPMFSGALFDSVIGDKTENAYKAFLDIAMPESYGETWIDSLKPLTRKNLISILKTLPYYFKRGYAFQDWKGYAPGVKKAFPSLPAVRVSAFLAMVAGINAAKYPAYVNLIKTGQWSREAVEQQTSARRSEMVENASYEVADKIKRGVGAVASTGAEIIESASDALPWYAKPKIIIPVLGIAGVLFLLGYSGLGKRLFRSRKSEPEYLQNPVSKRAKVLEKYEEFHGFKARRARSIKRIDTDNLAELGSALEIGYRSGKWDGKKRNYLHKFGKGVKLMSTPDGKALIITGGKLGVNDRGIIN